MKNKPRRFVTFVTRRAAAITALAVGAFLLSDTATHASLTAYYTLDDLASGIQNRGTNGSASDLSSLNAGATPTVVAGGIVGSAMSFDGNDLLRSLTAGNEGDNITAYPFTLSIWVRNTLLDTARDAVFSISDRTVGDRYYSLGVEGVSGRGEPELIRRNTTFTPLDATGTDVSGGTWMNIAGIFGPNTAEIYVNGKLINSAAISQTFNPSVNTMNIGGFLRNNGTTPTDPYRGEADEAGLFDTALVAGDIALINGLGLTGAIGLDQLDEAQALNAMAPGTIGQIGNAAWQRVTGLSGSTGDFGGTVDGGDAFIVTDDAGNGLRVVPEPGSGSLLLFASALGFMRQRRRS
jgi:hypothetical protein